MTLPLQAQMLTGLHGFSICGVLKRGVEVKRVFFTASVALVLALGLAAAGGATVPGPNGVIVFRAVTEDGSSQVFTIASDGGISDS